MWQCIGLAVMTCVVATLVASLIWLMLRRRCPSRKAPAQGTSVSHITDLAAFLRAHPHAVVLFHASWCGHCRQMLPAYEKAAARLQLPLAAMECDHAEDVVQQYGLRGYPTVLKFRPGRAAAEYSGDRSEEDLVRFVRAE